MKSLSIGIALFLALVSPANAHEGADEDKNGIGVVIDTKTLRGSPDAMTIWIAYAMGRTALLNERVERGEKLAAGDDYEIELAGREMLTIEELGQRDGAKPDAYLQLLRNIKAAGFLDEYVVAAFAIPGWTIPAAAINGFDFDGFGAFVKTNPLGDNHPTHAYTEVHGKRWPDAPGATLVDPATLKIQGPVCTETQKTIAAELAKWDQTAGGLRGAPVAADTRAEFMRVLVSMKRDGTTAPRGVTWITARPALLKFMAGFCAVELQDPVAAEASLRQAVELRPSWTAARMELVSVLLMQKKLAEAESLVDGTLGMTTDRCELASAHRRRGYIRIDQGRLVDARADYRKSLEYAPGNEIALHELKVIDQELKKQGNRDRSDGAPWEPPPMGDIKVTKC